MKKELKETLIAEREKWNDMIDIANISIITKNGETVTAGGILIDIKTMEYLKKRVICNINKALSKKL